MNGTTKELVSYETWYDFKTKLQRRSGIVLLNKVWLQVKPQAPLPWTEPQMRESLKGLSGRILKLKRCPRCSGYLILDRDSDGYYKRCILCSFEIELLALSVNRRGNGSKPAVKKAEPISPEIIRTAARWEVSAERRSPITYNIWGSPV